MHIKNTTLSSRLLRIHHKSISLWSIIYDMLNHEKNGKFSQNDQNKRQVYHLNFFNTVSDNIEL